MLYYLILAVEINPGSAKVSDFSFSWLVMFFGLVLLLKLIAECDSPIAKCFAFKVPSESLDCENLTTFATGRTSAMFFNV